MSTAIQERTVTLRFTGSRGGEGPLSWGQRAIWRLIHRLGEGDPYYNIPWTLPIVCKVDLDTVLTALRTLVERHETLRTTFGPGPDGLVQRVARTGELTVGVVDAGAGKPLAKAKNIAAGLAGEVFDYANELPIRCTVVISGGRPRAVAFGLSHLAVDGWGLELLAAEWRCRLKAAEAHV